MHKHTDVSGSEAPSQRAPDEVAAASDADNVCLCAARAACRQAVSSQHSSELKYRRLYSNMADAFIATAMDGHVLEFNPALQAMLGYSADELQRLTYMDLTPLKWHVLERDIVREQVLPHGHSCVYEKEYRRKDGTVFPIELCVHLVRDDAGQPASMWAIVRDITARRRAESELRESEERFRTVLEQSIDVAYRRNLKTDRYDYLSPAIEGITGFSVEEFSRLSSAALLEQIHPDDHPVILRRFEQFERSRHGFKIQDLFEFRIRRKDGAYRWISDSGVLITDTDGNPLYHVGVARDVTERKQMEDALLESNERLEKTVAERTARLRRLATELTLAEQRERRRLSDFLHDDLQQVLVAAKFRAEKLALDQKTAPLKKEALMLHDLVLEALHKTRSIGHELVTPLLYVVGFGPALHQLAEQMRERHSLRVDMDTQDVPDLFPEDIKVQLFHAVRELLFNVAKHADTHTASVRLKRLDGQVEITVADAGKGFDPGKVKPDDPADCGYGLFSISERLGSVGGAMRIDSAPGCGTRITISVPLPAETKAAPRARPRETVKKDRTCGTGVRARVLVADDHELVRHGVTQLLSQDSAFDVVGEAANGREALALARELRPDVIVMDVRMPEMDGIEATRLIKAEFPDTVVVGISAFNEAGFRSEMLLAGAVELLDKVDAGETLVATVARCLAGRCREDNP